MKRKTVKLRLSPNEEAVLAREELQRRRKLRLQQVREQERYIAHQVRCEVRERRERELQNLAGALEVEWQQQQRERLETLQKVYQDSLQCVGEGHRSAKENEPDTEALARRKEEQQVRAKERHREALRELTHRRHMEEEERSRHITARKKALLAEKERAAKVASLPPPPPNPIESIGLKTPGPVKMADVEHFSTTRHHMPETAVDRERDTEQPDAREAALVEAQRLEELEKEEARDRQEQLEKARLRGGHALRREKLTQDRARLLAELEHLQQADLLRRRQVLNDIPAQVFQPLYRRQEMVDEQQRELEIAFQDMYTGERKVKGDLVLQLAPEPLPAPSTGSRDEELDVTLDPEVTPGAEQEETVERSASPPPPPPPPTQVASSATGRDPSRQALRKLLDRIRTQRVQWSRREATDVAMTTETGRVEPVTDGMSIETGSLSSEERGQPLAVEEQIPETSQPPIQGPETSEESVVAGTLLRPEEREDKVQAAGAERREREEALLRQQQEQLSLLEELEEKRRSLELRLQEAQKERERLQQAAKFHSGTCSAPNVPAQQEGHPEATPAPEAGGSRQEDTHTQRLRQYQQRLLEQNRLHKQCIEDARRRLEEYQRTLKLRHSAATMTAAQLPPPVTMGTGQPLDPVSDIAMPLTVPSDLASVPAGPLNDYANSPSPLEIPTRDVPQSHSLQYPRPEPEPIPPLPQTRPPPQIQPHPAGSPVVLTMPPAPVQALPQSLSRLVQSPTPHADGSVQTRGGDLSPKSGNLQGEQPESLRPELREVPLPPPSVVLELLRSRHAPAVVPERSASPPLACQDRQPPVGVSPAVTPDSLKASTQPGIFLPGQADQEQPPWATAGTRDREVREHLRRQKDALQALLNAEDTQPRGQSSAQGSEVQQVDQRSLLDILLTAIEESNGLLPSAASASQNVSNMPTPLLPANGSVVQPTVDGRPRVKPPVSKPPTRLAFLQGLEQHELSAIQEVDTPANISLNTELQAGPAGCVDGSDAETSSQCESSSVSLPSLDQQSSSGTSGLGRGQNARNTGSRGSTGRRSRLSWRDRFRLDSEASQTESGRSLSNRGLTDELDLTLQRDRVPAAQDLLSSTTISTGSYSTSEQDLNYTAADSSVLGVESGNAGVAAPSSPLLSSSSAIGQWSPTETESQVLNRSVQSIIAKYTKELDLSLRTAGKHTAERVGRSPVSRSWSSVLQQDMEPSQPSLSHSVNSSVKQDPQTVSQRYSESSTSSLLSMDHGESSVLGSRLTPAADISSLEISGHFLPLQPQPDLNSSSSSSSHQSKKNRRAQEWDDTVRRIIDHLSDQLSIDGRDTAISHLIEQSSHQSRSLDPSQDRDSSLSRLIGQLSSQSSSGVSAGDSSDRLSRHTVQDSDQSASSGANQTGDSDVSRVIGQFADQSTSHWLIEGQNWTEFSQLIGRASDLQSSQVLDESSVLPGDHGEVASHQQSPSSAAAGSSIPSVDVGGGGQAAVSPSPGGATEVGSLSHAPSEPDPSLNSTQQPLQHGRPHAEFQHGDTESDSFHALLPEMTHNDTQEGFASLHLTVEEGLGFQTEEGQATEAVGMDSDWQEPLDASLPSQMSDLSPEHLRAEGPDKSSQHPLQLSLDQLSVSQGSPHASETVVPPTADDTNLTMLPPMSETCLRDDRPDHIPPVDPEEDRVKLGPQILQQSPDDRSASGTRLSPVHWEKILDDAGSVKGILEESEITLVSLSETTLQEHEITLSAEEEKSQDENEGEEREQDGKRDEKEKDEQEGAKATHNTVYGNQNLKTSSSPEESKSWMRGPESSLSNAVMLLEFQSSPSVPLQEAFLQRRRELAQRSARRVEELKARKAESRKTHDAKKVGPKAGSVGKPSPALPGDVSVQKEEPSKSGGVSRLKKVGEVKIVTPEQRHVEETEMYKRTERLYSQLEEVRQRRELRSRQESYAKNREKAKEFQKKTLQKLRAKQARK